MRRDDEMPGYDQEDDNYNSPEFNTGREEDDDYSNTRLDDESDDRDAAYSSNTEDDYDVEEDDAVNDDISDPVSSGNASQQPKGKPVYIKDMPPIDGAVRQGGV